MTQVHKRKLAIENVTIASSAAFAEKRLNSSTARALPDAAGAFPCGTGSTPRGAGVGIRSSPCGAGGASLGSAVSRGAAIVPAAPACRRASRARRRRATAGPAGTRCPRGDPVSCRTPSRTSTAAFLTIVSIFLHFVCLLGCITTDQLVEITFLSSGSFVLNEQCQIAFVELLEPFVPFNRLQRILAAVAGEVQANHAHVISATRSANTAGSCSAFLCPAPNFLVVG
jgi:hypothetical protein